MLLAYPLPGLSAAVLPSHEALVASVASPPPRENTTTCVNPAPMVSPWSPYFAAAYLLIRPDATREVLLNAIRHPYDRARAQVVRVASEKPEAHGGSKAAAADTGAGR